MAEVTEVSGEDFGRLVLRAERPVVVDFSADWCAPCRVMVPEIEQLAEELDGQVDFVKVDVDRDVEVAAAYGVSSIPAFLLFEDGRPVARTVGARRARALGRELGLPEPAQADTPTPRFRLFSRRHAT
jgi:thioredoxin